MFNLRTKTLPSLAKAIKEKNFVLDEQEKNYLRKVIRTYVFEKMHNLYTQFKKTDSLELYNIYITILNAIWEKKYTCFRVVVKEKVKCFSMLIGKIRLDILVPEDFNYWSKDEGVLALTDTEKPSDQICLNTTFIKIALLAISPNEMLHTNIILRKEFIGRKEKIKLPINLLEKFIEGFGIDVRCPVCGEPIKI